MKILYLRTLYMFNLKAGGSVAHTAGVINSLQKQVDVDVISNDSLAGVKYPITIITPVKISIFPNAINEFLYNFKIISKLKSKKLQYDAVYHRHSGFSFAGAYLASRNKIPFILEFNSSEIWKIKNWRDGGTSIFKRIVKLLYNYIVKLPIVSFIEKYNLNKASVIIVVSDVLKTSLIKQGIPERKILVNPNGIDIDAYSDIKGASAVRKQLGIRENVKVAGFVGTFGQWHGVLELARAIVRFYDKYPNDRVRFLLIGDGILLPEAKNIISNSPYESNVIFTGLVCYDECPKYLAACDIFLSPHIQNPDGTEFFGSPTKLFEYMAIGRPIIASDVGQIGKILKHRESAYLVEQGNVEQLADAIHTITNDEQLASYLAENARKEVIEKYTWDKHVENILNKVREVKQTDD